MNPTQIQSVKKFPTIITGASMFIIIVALISFTIFSIQMHNIIKYNDTENNLTRLRGTIVYLDELLTMSIYMAAVTGDLRWKYRYDHYLPVLNSAINEINNTMMTENSFLADAAKKTDIANTKLVVMEQKAFDLINQNKLEAAKQILFSHSYQDQKQIYFSAMTHYDKLLAQIVENNAIKKVGYLYAMMSIVFLSLLVSLLAGIISYRYLKKWKLSLENAIAFEFEQERKLEESQRLLEKRIKQRTIELKQKNEELASTITHLNMMQQTIIQSEKMATVGQLSAGIAHEVNNPLSYVISNINTLNKRLIILMQLYKLYQNLLSAMDDSNHKLLQDTRKNIEFLITEKKIYSIFPDLNNLVEESMEGLSRIKKIVSNLGSFTAKNEDLMTQVNINFCIESAIEIIWNQLKYKCVIEKNFTEIPTILGSAEQFKMIFIALLLNAAESIEDKGRISINSKVMGSEIEISISDTGCGIAPENLSKIFTPFFTTKAIGNGIGLGLSTTYAIVKSYNGNITVQSQLGVGSTFVVRLPIPGNKYNDK